VLCWEGPLNAVRDSRRQPKIATRVVIWSAVVMFLTRLGSLNALEQTKPSTFWSRRLSRKLPSADTVGRVAALTDPAGVRAVHHHLYSRLKRMKVLGSPSHGLIVAILDGHESHATFRRCCSGCLKRRVHTQQGDRTQYYHRHVALSLVGDDFYLMLDAEPQRRGEDEVAAALRLLDRVLEAYPRAFDVVLADGLYATGPVFNHVVDKGKHAIAVLKDDRRDLYEDALSLMGTMPPTVLREGGCRLECWDIEGFTSWPQVQQPVRVVRTAETRSIKRQLDKKREHLESGWMWVTTLSRRQASTRAVVRIGHSRWTIENQGFNEMVNRWHADHVYKHEPTAMLVFWLLAMLCLNAFLAFYRRNLKPALRRCVSMLHVAREIAAELYTRISRGRVLAPT
jgi:hypothetical protein